MESSSPSHKTSKHEKSPSSLTDDSDYDQYTSEIKYGNFGKKEKGFLSNINTASSLGAKSNGAYENFSTLEEDEFQISNFKKINNKWLLDTWYSGVPADRIWGKPFFFTSSVHTFDSGQCKSTLTTSIDDGDKHSNYFAPKKPSGRSTSSVQSTTEHLYNYDDDWMSPKLHGGYQLLEDEYNYKPHTSVNRYEEATYGYPFCNGPFIGIDADQMIHRSRDYQEIERLIELRRGTFLNMMSNDTHLFEELLDTCDSWRLESIAHEILLDGKLFVNAPFSAKGAISTVKLIKKLKKSSYAFIVTRNLSTRFLDIMTHDIARTVIQQCLTHFGSEPNEILFESAIYYFANLAVDKVGCRSLNECIDTINGEQRPRLLKCIADHSCHLANDTYGQNFVVQHILGLKNNYVTDSVLCVLQGHFIPLARHKGGSHVVEKCMKSSNNGLIIVVQEILDSSGAAFDLAQDIFGNYIIQSALKLTKERGLFLLYSSLVKALQPHCRSLYKTAGEKNVISLIK